MSPNKPDKRIDKPEGYSFLLKPAFFIFNMIFAAWLVLSIEQLRPSHFGRYKSFLEGGPARKRMVSVNDKPVLFRICADYKNGKIDSTEFDRQIEVFLGGNPEEK